MKNVLQRGCLLVFGCRLEAILGFAKEQLLSGHGLDAEAIQGACIVCRRDIVFAHAGMNRVQNSKINVLHLDSRKKYFSPNKLVEWLQPLISRVRFSNLEMITQENPYINLFEYYFLFIKEAAEIIFSMVIAGEKRGFIFCQVIK